MLQHIYVQTFIPVWQLCDIKIVLSAQLSYAESAGTEIGWVEAAITHI